MKIKLAALLLIVPILMGAKDTGGCTADTMPTVAQIELNIPDSLLTCPYAPKSPGANASQRQTAVYIVGLYNAWEVCHANVTGSNEIYTKYRGEIDKIKRKYAIK